MDMDLERYLRVEKGASVNIGGKEESFDVQKGIDIDRLSNDVKAQRSMDENLEIAAALCGYCIKIFKSYGTDKSYVSMHNIDSQQSHQIMHLLKFVCVKLKIKFDSYFNDFDSFFAYWRENGAAGSGGYARRRKMVDDQFGELQKRIEDLQVEREASASSLARPITSAKNTGWTAVDREIEHLRKDFAEAKDTMDYSNIGNDAVGVIDKLSATVYSKLESEGLLGDVPMSEDETKNRLCLYVEKKTEDGGKSLRKFCKDTVTFTQVVKHDRRTVNRKKAGIAADAVIMLANILRRLDS